MVMMMVMVKLIAPLQSAPLLVSSSPLVLGSIDLAPGVAEEQAFLDWVGGNTVLEGSQPMAHRCGQETSWLRKGPGTRELSGTRLFGLESTKLLCVGVTRNKSFQEKESFELDQGGDKDLELRTDLKYGQLSIASHRQFRTSSEV